MNIIKKKLTILAIFIFSLITLLGQYHISRAISTPNTSMIEPSPLALGYEQHTYNISLKDNGEAFIKARLAIGNTHTTDREEVSLDFGDAVLVEPLFYQQIISTKCNKAVSIDCLDDNEPDYYAQYFGYYNSSYVPLTYINNNGKYIIKLKSGIKNGTTGAIILSFRTKSYTKNLRHGLYKINYHTPKYNFTIDQATVNIGSNINKYIFRLDNIDISNANYKDTAYKSLVEPNGASALDSFTNSIYQDYFGTTSGSNIMSQESLVISGEYAQSGLILYRHTVIVLVLLSLMIIVFAIISYVLLMHKNKWVSNYNPWRDIRFYVLTFIIGSLALLKSIIVLLIFHIISNKLFDSISAYRYLNNISNIDYTVLARLAIVLIILILDIAIIMFMSFIVKAKTRFVPLVSFIWQFLYLPLIFILFFLLFLSRF